MSMTFQDPICQADGCRNPTVAYVNVNSAAASSVPSQMEARCAEHGGAGWSSRTFGNTKDGNPADETLSGQLAAAESRVARLEALVLDFSHSVVYADEQCVHCGESDRTFHAADCLMERVEKYFLAIAPTEPTP